MKGSKQAQQWVALGQSFPCCAASVGLCELREHPQPQRWAAVGCAASREQTHPVPALRKCARSGGRALSDHYGCEDGRVREIHGSVRLGARTEQMALGY